MPRPTFTGEGGLPPITHVYDDPVVTALAALHGIDFEAMIAKGAGGRQLKVAPVDHAERDETLPEALPSLSIGLAGGNYTGQVIVEFGDGLYRYQRSTGRATVRIPIGALPDTVVNALVGTEITRIVDIPGLGGWTVASATTDPITESTVAELRPPEG